MRQNRILQIESDVRDRRAWLLVGNDSTLFREGDDHIRTERVNCDIRRAFSQFKRSYNCVRHDSESRALNVSLRLNRLSRISEVSGIPLERDLLIRDCIYKLKRPRPDRFLRDLRS